MPDATTPTGASPVTDGSAAIARGRAARDAVPRSRLGEFEPPAGRDDPIDLLERQAATRIPELLPIRYGRMLASPFAFYRGAAAIMASDLASSARTGFQAQCCGDAHLSNFGLFASPERRLVFDINDFDETLPGPWEWDIKRLAASVMIAARERELSARDQRDAVQVAAAEYRRWLTTFARSSSLEVWYAHVTVESLGPALAAATDAKTRRQAGKLVAKARTRDGLDALSKLTETIDGAPRIISRPPLIVPVADLVGDERDATIAALREIYESYRKSLADDRRVLLDAYELVDLARKVVGVGSVGTQSWIALLLGRDNGEPLFLQIKEAGASVLEQSLGASRYANSGRRVVEGQRLMIATSDIFLGWLGVEQDIDGRPRDYYVRQLRDWKASASVEEMAPSALIAYGRLCGATLARAHARSGDRVAIAAYLGTGTAFDKAMVEFAGAYADQNERDYSVLAAAVRSGRIAALTGI